MRWLLAFALVSVSLAANAGNFPGTGMRGLTGNDSGGVDGHPAAVTTQGPSRTAPGLTAYFL